MGHLRFLLERFGPELRQYIVTSNDEERPFSRDQRRWIYSSAKLENYYFGFGTDNDVENAEAYPIIKHRTFTGPGAPSARHARRGGAAAGGQGHGRRARTTARLPAGLGRQHLRDELRLAVQNAIEALNRGAALAGCLHNTGEGALSPYHRNGGDVIFQIGTSYFGCRDDDGVFELARLVDLVQSAPVKAIEIKLSQGAKPGLGGMLPGAKVTQEIAEIRGIPVGKDCASPSRHQVFHDVDSMLDFVELVADATGAAGRHQVGRGQPGLLGPARPGDGRGWSRGRLRQRRRR